MSGRRWVNVRINENIVNLVFAGQRDASYTSDWPPDATIISGRWDQDRAQFVLTIESSVFPEVPLGDHLMDWNPTFTVHTLDQPSAQSLIDLIDKMHEEELDEAATRA